MFELFRLLSSSFVLALIYASDLVSLAWMTGFRVYSSSGGVHNLSRRDIWGATHWWDGIQSRPPHQSPLARHCSSPLHPPHYIEQSRLFVLQIHKYRNEEIQKLDIVRHKNTHIQYTAHHQPPPEALWPSAHGPAHLIMEQKPVCEGPQRRFIPHKHKHPCHGCFKTLSICKVVEC